jgi:hypothetical protein
MPYDRATCPVIFFARTARTITVTGAARSRAALSLPKGR